MGEYEPRIIGFLCNWCSYAGADLAGTSRVQYPPNVRIIRVMCSGRINPLFVLKAFQLGADGVLVSGCHPGDCHYAEGNYYARRRLILYRKHLEYIGIDPKRFQVSWVSASEGGKFGEVISNFRKQLVPLGPNPYFKEVIGLASENLDRIESGFVLLERAVAKSDASKAAELKEGGM